MTKIKDTDYLAHLQPDQGHGDQAADAESRMEQILEARSDEEAAKILQECGYRRADRRPIPRRWTACSAAAREAMLADLSAGAPDAQVYRDLQAEV